MTDKPDAVAELEAALRFAWVEMAAAFANPDVAELMERLLQLAGNTGKITWVNNKPETASGALRQSAATLTTLSRRNAELEAALNAQRTCCDCDKVFSGAGQGAYICNGCAGAD